MKLDITSVRNQDYILGECYKLGWKVAERNVPRPSKEIPMKIRVYLKLFIVNGNDLFDRKMEEQFLAGYDAQKEKESCSSPEQNIPQT